MRKICIALVLILVFTAAGFAVSPVRMAVEDLAKTFGDEYPHAKDFLEQLDQIESKLENIPADQQQPIREAINSLADKALKANPLVTRNNILFVVRKQYRSDHHNTATMFVTGEINTGSFTGGGALKIFNPATGKTKTLLETSEGVIRDPELSFDGKRIVFSMRKNIGEDYHIYEMGTGGEGLRQLTSMIGVADFDPVYMPDGSIVFSSTREPKYCGCNRHIMGNLFKMDADGANIHQIAKSTLHEGHATVMSDGRILYDRWEYIDRNFGDAQGLWTVNPDGTNQSVYWGNNTASPGGVIDARQIPGTQRVVCTFISCHDRPWGAIAIIDRRLGVDGRKPVIRTWPVNAIELVDKGNLDTFRRVTPKYEDPYPLSKKYFFCSRMTGAGERMGIYLIDVFGNETLLHTEKAGCFDPMPIKVTTVPNVVPNRRDYENEKAVFYVADVYEGTHTKGIKRGSVKFLRVVESPEKRHWTKPAWGGQGSQSPGMNWHNFENKRILSTVPVEADGSTYFKVPSDTYVFFQLLDEKGMMIQSMRSGTVAQSGEVTGCVGCHDNRRIAPPVKSGSVPIALHRAPSKLNGWHGQTRLFSYTKEVQPVFDKHCVKCHDFGKKAGEKLVLAGDRSNTFNASYVDLWMKKYINCVGAGSHLIQPAYSWGSRKSKLVKKIAGRHKGVKLSDEEFDRIVTWIDLNGPYYPSYASAYPNNLAGRSPLNNKQLARLRKLVGINFNSLANHRRKLGTQISFDRPKMSRCLLAFKDKTAPEYIEALAIIQQGAEALKQKPRADMDGFVPETKDLQRQLRYLDRQKKESQNRQAIKTGQKLYDKPKSDNSKQ